MHQDSRKYFQNLSIRVCSFLQHFGLFLIMALFFCCLIKICEQIQTLDHDIGDETCLEHLRHKMVTLLYFNATDL